MPQPSTQPAPALFIAVGQQGVRITSPDGQTWSHQQTGKEGETYRAVAYGNNRYVAVGSYGGKNIFASSADGQTWQTGEKDGQYRFYVRGLGFGNNAFLGVGGDPGSVGGSEPFVISTIDGVKWGEFTPISGKNIIRRIAWGNDRFVGVGDRGRRATSKDGKTWIDVPAYKAIDTLVDIAFGNGLFVGVGLHGLRMTSEDGLKWSDRIPGEEGEHLNSVIYTGERFVAIGAGATYASTDGLKWSREPDKDAPTVAAHGKVDGKDVYVGCTWKGRILRSADAVHWEQVHKGEFNFEAVTFAR